MEISSILAGGLVGFLVAIGKDWLIESKKQKEKARQLRREKLEELYMLVSHWSIALLGNGISLLAVMQNKLSYNQYLDILIEKNVSHDFHRIEMILDIYAPDLHIVYKKLLEARTDLNNIENEHKLVYTDGNIDGVGFIKSYILDQDIFEKLTNVLKIEIANLVLEN